MKKINLKFKIDTYDLARFNDYYYKESYDIEYQANSDESFYAIIEDFAYKYKINSKTNNEFYYWLVNFLKDLWGEYFNTEFISKYILNGVFYDYSKLDVPVGKLDKQFNLSDKTIHLCICGPGTGGDVGRKFGIKFYFHTNEKDIHHTPHIHCKCGSEEMRINLKSLKIMDKPFKEKSRNKNAVKYVSNNQKVLLNYWNKVVVNGETIKLEMDF